MGNNNLLLCREYFDLRTSRAQQFFSSRRKEILSTTYTFKLALKKTVGSRQRRQMDGVYIHFHHVNLSKLQNIFYELRSFRPKGR